MKKIMFFLTVIIITISALSVMAQAVELQKDSATGELRLKPTSNINSWQDMSWQDMGIAISPEATMYLSMVQKAINHKGETIPISSPEIVFLGMKDFFHAEIANKFSQGIVFDGKSVRVVGEYQESPKTVFAWFNLFALMSIVLMFISNIMISKNKDTFAFAAFVFTFAIAIAIAIVLATFAFAAITIAITFAAFAALTFALKEKKKMQITFNVAYCILMLIFFIIIFLK